MPRTTAEQKERRRILRNFRGAYGLSAKELMVMASVFLGRRIRRYDDMSLDEVDHLADKPPS